MKSGPVVFGITIVLFLVSAPLGFSQSAEIVITPGGGSAWTLTLDVSDLTGVGGTDFTTPRASNSDQVDIAVTKVNAHKQWTVYISRTDTTWNANLHLYARRTADGTGDGTISGGDNYIEINTTEQDFFVGTDLRSGIKVQYRLDGLSTQYLDVNTFLTTVNYRITTK